MPVASHLEGIPGISHSVCQDNAEPSESDAVPRSRAALTQLCCRRTGQVLKRLVLPDGTILRAQLPGRPTRDSLFRDPLRDNKSLLKARPAPLCPLPWTLPQSNWIANRTEHHSRQSTEGRTRAPCLLLKLRTAAHACSSPADARQQTFHRVRPSAQVWNSNRHSGLVGVFHLQGAAWSRASRQFLVHDASPPPLSATVRCLPGGTLNSAAPSARPA